MGTVRVAAHPEAIDEILDGCAGLPLALAIVASQATRQPRTPLTDFADAIRKARGLDAFAGGDSVTDMRRALSWSYQYLSPAAARLLRLLGRIAGPTFTTSDAAQAAGVPAAAVRAALAELRQLYLVGESATDCFALTPLLRAYTDELAPRSCERPGERGEAGSTVAGLVCENAGMSGCYLTTGRVELPPLAVVVAMPR